MPQEVALGSRVFAVEGVGENDVAGSVSEVALMEGVNAFDVNGERLDQVLGDEGDAILAALAEADGEFAAVEVDVLDAQAAAFEQAEA